MSWQWVGNDWFDAIAIEKRLKERVSLVEFGAIIFLITWLLGLVFVVNQKSIGLWWDINVYIDCGRGQCDNYYYGYWLLPFFSLLGKLPNQIIYIVWGLVNIAGAWFAIRAFGGSKFLALVSYPMLSILWFGQIGGLIIASLAFGWYGIVKRNWVIAGIGLGIALAKYNVALILIIPIILVSKLKFKEWGQIIIWPTSFLGVSLLLYPGWILQLLSRLHFQNLSTTYSVSIWPYLGPVSLALLLPLFFIPTKKCSLFIGWAIVGTIVMPYYQLRDMLLLLSMPLPVGVSLLIGYFGFTNLIISSRIVLIYIVFQTCFYFYFLWQSLLNRE